MKVKEILLSIAEYTIYFALFMYFTTPIHEWVHLQLLRFLGGDGYIVMTWYGASVIFTRQPSHPTIVALGGGIAAAFFYSLKAYWNYISMDWEELAALLPHIGGQLFYGIFEGLYIYTMPFSECLKWASIVQSVGFMLGLLVSLYVILKWWIEIAEN